jgi:hypothetical protein
MALLLRLMQHFSTAQLDGMPVFSTAGFTSYSCRLALMAWLYLTRSQLPQPPEEGHVQQLSVSSVI